MLKEKAGVNLTPALMNQSFFAMENPPSRIAVLHNVHITCPLTTHGILKNHTISTISHYYPDSYLFHYKPE